MGEAPSKKRVEPVVATAGIGATMEMGLLMVVTAVKGEGEDGDIRLG